MSKSLLVTGGGGFVGHHFIEHVLLNTDWNVVSLDSFRHKGDSLRLRHLISNPRLQVICHDLNAPISDRLAGLIGRVDYVLNIASDSHVPRSISDPVPFVQNNTNLMLHILEYCRKVQPEKVIQCSSDEVFGPAVEGQAHREWDATLPSSPYSASKAMQNCLAFSYWRTYRIPIMITHTLNMFGERQETEKFIPLLISKISKNEKVVIHGSPECIGKRFYIHCRNLSDGWLFLLNHVEPTRYISRSDIVQKPDAFNITGPTEVDNLTLAELVASMMERPLHYEFVDFEHVRAGHDFRYCLDGSKMERLGWTPPVPFEESLRRMVNWTLSNREWLL